MLYQDAINIRTSRRSYLPELVDFGCLNKLRALIDEYNHKAGLNMQLVVNCDKAFKGFLKSYGIFSGVKNYIGMIANKEDEHSREKLGYYGQLIVLQATDMRLGTCWVSGTFDRKSCPFKLSENEYIECVITFGNVENERSAKEKFIRSVSHRKSKKAEDIYISDVPIPTWFQSGIRSVLKAPSAMNRQPVTFTYKDGSVVATVNDMSVAGMALDLGIAKLHFELGASGGEWEWGNEAKFTLNCATES